MNDLPKDQSNDFKSFTGVYPEPTVPKPNETSSASPFSVDKNSTPSQSQPPQEIASSSGGVPSAVTPFTSSTPVMTTVPATETVSSPSPFVSQEPAVNVPQSVSPLPPAEPSFTTSLTPDTPAPKSSGASKRLLMVLLLIIGLLVIGFLLFRFVGSFLAGNQPITLTYWGLWEDEKIFTSIVSQYKETHPNIEIVYAKQSPKQYRKRLQAAIDRGEGPDIFRFHNTWVPMLREQLAPAGKTGYSASDFQQTFYPVASSDLILGSNVYGVPLMIDGLGLYYNEDLLRAAGVTPPTTWEDFRTAALSMTVRDENNKIVTAGAALGTANNVEHFSDILALMMFQNGADLKQPTSKEAQDALAFYRLFAQAPTQVWDETLDNSILAFANGKVAFMFAPSWQVFTIRQTNPNLKFRIIPVPQLPGATVSWASYWAEGVSQKSTHIDESWEFITFLSQKEQLISLYSEQSKLRDFGEPYSRVDLAQTLINDPYVGAYIHQAPTAKSFFLSSRTFDEGINDSMIKYLEDAVNSLSQGVSVDAALTTASQGFSQTLTSFQASATQ